MKQYLNSDQTANLIEMGFEKPKGWYVDGVTNNIKLYVNIDENPMMFNYSIGELIEMLPTAIETGYGYALSIYHNRAEWMVSYDDNGIYLPIYSTEKDELIDALYDMVVKLKEEGVI